MASSWAATSAQKGAVDLPEKSEPLLDQILRVGKLTTSRFLCRNCNKFKPPALFSNKELNSGYRRRLGSKPVLNGITAKLRCRNCSGDQSQELQCVGPCDLWKSLDEFSRNQRRHPDEAWCLTCTQWKEANEPGVIPIAAPNAPLAPDEEHTLVEEETGFVSYADVPGTERDAQSEADVNVPRSPRSAGISVIVAAGSRDGSTTSTTKGPLVDLAPADYLASRMTCGRSDSSLSDPYDIRTEHEPVRASVAHSQEISGMPGQDTDGWASADHKRRDHEAWELSGQTHRHAIASSSAEDATTSAGSQIRETIGDRGGARGGFAGAAGRAYQPTHFPPVKRPIKQNKFQEDEDDEDPDEM